MHGPTCIFWANLTPFSLKIFEMFRCRAVSATVSLLEQDLTITCYEGAHAAFAALAAVFMLLYPIGIPLALFLFMRKYKSSITPTTDKAGKLESPGNPDFILIRPDWTRAFCHSASLILVCVENPYKSNK